MTATPFQELNLVLEQFILGLKDSLGKNLVGVYLQGSFATGDFDEHSDVDFVVVLEDPLSAAQVEVLQALHERIFHLGPEWAKHLEGSYFPRQVLADLTRCGEDLWYLDNGSSALIQADHCNTLIVRWVVREQGVILTGPPPKTLVDPIPTEMLREEMFDVLTKWGRIILSDPAPWSNRFYQGFIVLNYCRMLHDLRNGYPGSKRQGAEWARRYLDPAWSSLIDAAWECRPDPAAKVREPADSKAFQRTLEFLECIILESERFMAKRSGV